MPKRASDEEITEFLSDFATEFRKKLTKAYHVCGNDTGGGTFVIPKLVLIEVANSYGLPPSMKHMAADVKRLIETVL
jgi:hypothetical protein